jgi:DNA ligase-1
LIKGSAKFVQQHAHEQCKSLESLRSELARVESLGGEGLMLRQPGSKYVAGRSATLLKVKTFHDAEAEVVGHQAGAGRHKERMGALLVRLPDGTDFAIGTGFSDRERENPPAIGATVTFRYQELSDAGVPRFPSWVGVRQDITVKDSKSVSAAKLQSSTPIIIVENAGAKAKTRYFEFIQGNSSKFWEVSQSGNAMITRWGRIGSAGQSKTKTFADESTSVNAMTEIIRDKTAEGYIERSP